MMTCYFPLVAYRVTRDLRTGRPGITFNRVRSSVEGSSISVPCGRCIGCRLRKSGDWAVRCYHENQMCDQSSFLTLTFDDDHLPSSGSVDKRDLQLFNKRLRKFIYPRAIKFFACGEYSDEHMRPHYHSLIFNYQFTDLKFYKNSKSINPNTNLPNKIYKSEILKSIWPFGESFIGTVSYQSAGYVARYVFKKVTGDRAAEHYCWPHPVSGQLVFPQPEFVLMSNRPGLGETWLRKYRGDIRPSDMLVVDGKKVPIPLYYDRKLKEWAEEDALEAKRELRIKRQRILASHKHREDNTPERLAVRGTVKKAQLSQLKREL